MVPELLRRLAARGALSRAETQTLFDAIMRGAVEPVLLGAVLAALATKGETLDEIVGAAEAMRAHVTPVRAPPGVPVIDTCGTGGDGQPVFNVSSTVAIVAAAAGATVAKHGNRSNVRPSGSAEVLAALGVNIEADVPTLERCLAECHVAFLYAQRLHPAMRHAAPIRRTLGIRTIFNLVGPLTNPAGVRRQLLGVSRAELVEPMTTALQLLGAERALVVHGREGLCDLSTAGPSLVGRWDGKRLTVEEFDPQTAGLPRTPLERLFVRSAAESAALVRSVLAGTPGGARDIVVLNAAAALWVAGLAQDWTEGMTRANDALDSGAAARTLARWCEVSNVRSAE